MPLTLPPAAPFGHRYASNIEDLRSTATGLLATVVLAGRDPSANPRTALEHKLTTAFTTLDSLATLLLAENVGCSAVVDLLTGLSARASYQYYGNEYVKGGQVQHSISFDLGELAIQQALGACLRALEYVQLTAPTVDSESQVDPALKQSTAVYYGSTLVGFDTGHINPAVTNIEEVPLAPRQLIAGDLGDEQVLTSLGRYVAQTQEFIGKAISLNNGIVLTQGAVLNQRYIRNLTTDSLNNWEKLLTLLAVTKRVEDVYKPVVGTLPVGFPYHFDFVLA